jgi:hypothetical protein
MTNLDRGELSSLQWRREPENRARKLKAAFATALNYALQSNFNDVPSVALAVGLNDD